MTDARTARTVAVTGANGFIGGRLMERLAEMSDIATIPLTRGTDPDAARAALARADVVAHMAGVTRPRVFEEFDQGNRRLTEDLAGTIRANGTTPLILFASTVRAVEDTEYGRTKKAAEDALVHLAKDTGCRVAIFRLAQVFGRGARPYYNAISATLLADAAQGQATRLERPDDPIEVVDVADVAEAFAAVIVHPPAEQASILTVAPSHCTTVGTLADIAGRFGRGDRPDPDRPMEIALFDAFRGYREALSAGTLPRTP